MKNSLEGFVLSQEAHPGLLSNPTVVGSVSAEVWGDKPVVPSEQRMIGLA